jgi:hypothetical protein
MCSPQADRRDCSRSCQHALALTLLEMQAKEFRAFVVIVYSANAFAPLLVAAAHHTGSTPVKHPSTAEPERDCCETCDSHLLVLLGLTGRISSSTMHLDVHLCQGEDSSILQSWPTSVASVLDLRTIGGPFQRDDTARSEFASCGLQKEVLRQRAHFQEDAVRGKTDSPKECL